MEAHTPALEPPVLADRGLGQRASGAHCEERERAERLVLLRRRSVEHRARNHALGEVVAALERLRGRRREDAPIPQRLEHRLGRLPVPHVVAVAARPRSHASRAAPLRGSAPAPARPGRRARAARAHGSPSGAALHRAPEVRPELDREEARLVRPVLEHAAGGQQPPDSSALGVRADAARQREPVRPVDRRDRVELDRAEPADRFLDLTCLRAAEARRDTPCVDTTSRRIAARVTVAVAIGSLPTR